MSTRGGYHQPAGYDDDDSDADLDLNELDPRSSKDYSLPHRPSSRLPRSNGDGFGAHIPLRSLRTAARNIIRDEDAEDLGPLVSEDHDAPRQRDSATGSGASGDDAPLLANGRSRPLSGQNTSGTTDRSQRRNIWQFFTWGKRRASIALPFPTDDDSEEHDMTSPRTIGVGLRQTDRYPANAVSHAKYTSYSFLPRTLFNEFKFFFNMYFLLVALSQIIPPLRIGYLSTYVAPLAFVISITLGKEAYDDINRRKRDNEANSELYTIFKFDESSTGVDGGSQRQTNVSNISPRKRRRRPNGRSEGPDSKANEQEWNNESFRPSAVVTETFKPSKDLKVGDVIVLNKGQRLPADVVVLKSFANEWTVAAEASPPTAGPTDTTLIDMGVNATGVDGKLDTDASAGKPLTNETTTSDPSGGGEAFIRTDQLDGETDWKLRLATPLAQTLPVSEYVRLRVTAGKPDKKVNDFVGTIGILQQTGSAPRGAVEDVNTAEVDSGNQSAPLTIDNAAWANTVLASATTVHAVVVYTGFQTRAALSTSASRSKTGLLESEINNLTKILCFLTLALSFILVALEGFKSYNGNAWYVAVMRYLILFSTIVPISLRVNLDLGKSVYAWLIHRDHGIPGTVVRTSTIPEDLGRIEYLLTDKTGTLTRNEMELKKVHVGTVSYGGEAMEEVAGYVKLAFGASLEQVPNALFTPSTGLSLSTGATRMRREIGVRVRDLVLALALCHNVTPTTEENEAGQTVTSYQASSPDEIAIVEWTEQVGLRLAHRDRKTISLQFSVDGRTVVKVKILNIFPFTSDSKRMGIIVRFLQNANDTSNEGEIVFYQKGADTVMGSIVAANDWLDEETSNMAREGLRTLVIGRKNLSAQQYSALSAAYSEASLSLSGRDAAMARVVKEHLEHDLELLGVTGVEDRLQENVKPSLELLRNAGVRIWMLTGDKVETARCVAVSSKLVSRGQHVHTIAGIKRKEAALDALNVLHSHPNAALLVDGQSLAIYLQHHRDAFVTVAVRLPAVVACRCSPTQKADVAQLIRAYTRKRIACIGDGGNDVSMIQAADVGVGIVGKEGRQASLAADFSITQFHHLTKLLVWHGRNSYKRSAKLAQFVIHRGLIISVCQTVFNIASHFEPIALYRDWLLVGYATIYTMAPVFSLVLDRDVDENLANLYPELYKELTPGKSLSYRTFFIWVGISVYQGIVIQGGSELLLPKFGAATARDDLTSTPAFHQMVLLSYTVLVINELIMVAAEITTWHPVMIFSIIGTAAIYFGSLPFLGEYFDLAFLLTLGFWWRFVAISAASLGPVYAGKVIRRTVKPPSYRKVRGY